MMELTMWSDEKQTNVCTGCHLPVQAEHPHYGPYTCISHLIAEVEQQTERAAALAGDLRELRENVMLGLGMTAADVAAVDDDRADSTISYLLSGHAELAAEVERLEAVLKRRNQDYDEVFNDYEEMRAAWEAGAEVQAEIAAHRARITEWSVYEPGSSLGDFIAGLRAETEAAKSEAAALRVRVGELETRMQDEAIMAHIQQIVMETLQDEKASSSWESIIYNAGVGEEHLEEMLLQMAAMGLVRFVPGTKVPVPMPWARQLMAEVAALRAQLDAGEGWRTVSEPPSPGIDVEGIVRAEFKPNGNFRIVLPALKWRPAPPQE